VAENSFWGVEIRGFGAMLKFLGPSSALVSQLRRAHLYSARSPSGLRQLSNNVAYFSSHSRMDTNDSASTPQDGVKKKQKLVKYAKGQFLKRSEVDSFIEKKLKVAKLAALAIFMARSSSRSSVTVQVTYLIGFYPKIAARLEELISESWAFWQISAVINGMRCMRENEEGIQKMCTVTAKMIDRAINRGEVVLAGDVTMIMLGVTRLVGREVETRKLLHSVADIFRKCEEDFTPEELVTCMRGLQGKPSGSPEVLVLVSLLTERFLKMKTGISVVDLGHITYGMHRMKCDSVEVIGLLTALTARLREMDVELSAKVHGDMLFGLQSMSSDTPEVREFLALVLSKASKSDIEALPQATCNSFVGMRGMKCNVPEVVSLLKSLTVQANALKKHYHPQGLGMALLGFSSMHSDSAEVRAALKALTRHVQIARGNMDTTALGNAIHGFQNMKDDSPEVLEILQSLVRFVEPSIGFLSEEHVERCLFGLQGMSNESAEVRALLTALLAKARTVDKKYDENDVEILNAQTLALMAALEPVSN
jgi:hypothetical protein